MFHCCVFVSCTNHTDRVAPKGVKLPNSSLCMLVFCTSSTIIAIKLWNKLTNNHNVGWFKCFFLFDIKPSSHVFWSIKTLWQHSVKTTHCDPIKPSITEPSVQNGPHTVCYAFGCARVAVCWRVILSKSPYENFTGPPGIILCELVSTWICLIVREGKAGGVGRREGREKKKIFITATHTLVSCHTFGFKLM